VGEGEEEKEEKEERRRGEEENRVTLWKMNKDG
jgi:hypothetical protein